MDAATLLLLTSSVGVGFGWQPMPDGSPRVEYLVQIEPEMLTALEAGSVIPIVSEVPQEIGPIGRVRIVVGRETIPRQGLPKPIQAIRHKPNSDPHGQNDSGQISPAAPPAHVQNDSVVLRAQFTPSAPAGATNKTSSPSMPSQIAPPPGFTVNSAANNLYQQAIEAGERQAAAAQASVAKSATEMSNKIQNQLIEQQQQAADWLRQGLPMQTAPNGLKPANGTDSGNPVANEQVPNDHSTAHSTPPVTNSLAPGPRVMNAQTTAGAQGAAGGTGGMNSNLYPSVRGETPGLQRLDRPMPVGVKSGERQPVASQETRILGTGNSVPNEWSNRTAAPGFPQQHPTAPNLHIPAPEMTATKSSTAQTSYEPPANLSHESSAKSSTVVTQSSTDSLQAGMANKIKPQADSPLAQQESSGGGFTLLLAWVLLVGSVAGNLYLFWSYLDIRSKYHAMIRSNRGAHRSYTSAA